MKDGAAKSWIEVDGHALTQNIAHVDRYVGKGTALMLVVKANAYGHGLKEVAQILVFHKDAHMLGVDSLDEALALRAYGSKSPIMILGYIPSSRFYEAIRAGFHISLYDTDTVHRAVSFTKKHPRQQTYFHLKVETGTNRLGIQLHELERIKTMPPLYGLYTHFAEAENMKSDFSHTQRIMLERIYAFLKERGVPVRVVHMGATAALMHLPESRSSVARLGIGLYREWPSKEIERAYRRRLSIQPVLSWKTKLAQVKRIEKGESVGYDRTYRAKRTTEVGVLPVGYYDGYPRALSGKGHVLVRGKKCPIIGRICMNMMMADVTGVGAKSHDEVVLIGSQKKAHISVEDIAQEAGTINYEVISRISPLLPRIIT